MRVLVVSLCLAIGALGSPLGWTQYFEAENQGQIETVDIPTNSLMISGLIYRVAADAKVEIDGTYGAFTLLQPGMKVRILYRDISPTDREIVELETLPDNAALEEA